jgi:hypothetical protein
MKAFLNTLQGKVITGLTIIALIMGIGLEGIQIQTAYWTLQKVRVDAQSATLSGSDALPNHPANIDPDKLRPKPMSLGDYRALLKTWPNLEGVPQEKINRLAIATCKIDHGKDSPVCKE